MATPPSSYGDLPPLQGYRRSFTVPSRQLSVHERAGLDKADADADILYSHPSARIIAFSPPTDSIQPQSKETLPDADYPIDAVETLPWRSRTETLASSGPIKIEKVRGSSHFLKSADQKVIHTIMRNSQCWCVDGESKFVLRIGKFRYYRIELPSETEEDKQKVEELKAALGKVLRFERSPCPFKRAFHVDLPDDAITPRRKGTWKRRQPLHPTTPKTDPLPLRRTKNSRAWSFQAHNESSPVETYGRRGSDYGFGASRGSSRSRPDADGYRSSTPSSIASSEDTYERGQEDGSSEDGLQRKNLATRQQADEGPVNQSEPEQSTTTSAPNLLDDTSTNDEDSQHEEAEDASPTKPAKAPVLETREALIIEASAPSIQPQMDGVNEAVVEEAGMLEQAPEDLEDEPEQGEILLAVDHPEQESEKKMHHEEEASARSAFDEPVEESAMSMSSEGNPEVHLSQSTELAIGDDSAEAMNEPHLENALADVETSQSHTQEGDIVTDEVVSPEQDDDALSRVSSVDSFHTTDSLTQEIRDEQVHAIDFEKAPHTEGFTPFFLNKHQHRRGLSELTVTASTIASEQSPVKLRPSTSDSTPGLAQSSMSDYSWPSVHTPPSSPSPINENLRRRLQLKRSLSPLPPSTTLYSPSTSPANHGSPFTAAFLQKAANVALVKPIEAVVLLVHILARIAGGATLNDLFSGDLFRRPSEGTQHPHRRRTSFPDQPAQPRDDSEEDDFGVPIRGRTKSVDFSPAKANATAKEGDDGANDADSIFDLD